MYIVYLINTKAFVGTGREIHIQRKTAAEKIFNMYIDSLHAQSDREKCEIPSNLEVLSKFSLYFQFRHFLFGTP